MIQSDLERNLQEGPEAVSRSLLQWRQATLNKEMTVAKLRLRLKMENPDANATDLKFMLEGNDERYKAVLEEASFEAEYQKQYESLMAAKHLSRLREAF